MFIKLRFFFNIHCLDLKHKQIWKTSLSVFLFQTIPTFPAFSSEIAARICCLDPSVLIPSSFKSPSVSVRKASISTFGKKIHRYTFTVQTGSLSYISNSMNLFYVTYILEAETPCCQTGVAIGPGNPSSVQSPYNQWNCCIQISCKAKAVIGWATSHITMLSFWHGYTPRCHTCVIHNLRMAEYRSGIQDIPILNPCSALLHWVPLSRLH